MASARTWYIKPDGSGDAPTIQAGVDSAEVGDVVLVAAGHYTWTNQGTGSDYGLILLWRDRSGFELRSESGPEATILDSEGQGRVINLMAYNDVTIDGFKITGGVAPELGNFTGGGLGGHLSSPVIRNCIFSGNSALYGGGVWFGGVSGVRFENCRFVSNTARNGGGVFLINSSATMTFVGCVFENNVASSKGGGIFCYNVSISLEGCGILGNTAGVEGGGVQCENIFPSTIRNCTITENGSPVGGGIRLFRYSTIIVQNSIVSHSSQGAALGIETESSLDLGCSDLYGNAGGDDLPPEVIDSGGNFFLDPQFCGVQGTHFCHLQADSPCAPGNHPDGDSCGLIGAYPVSCGSVPVKDKSWGEIKALYRY